MSVFQGPSIEIARLNALHDFLTARGWVLAWSRSPGEDGYPTDPESSWHYPASFGGVPMNEVGDVTPCRLGCRFTFYDNADADILVEPAGNDPGCDQHRPQVRLVEHGDDELAELAEVLDEVEAEARGFDARDFVECLFFGDCGRR